VTKVIDDIIEKASGKVLRVGTTYRAMMTAANDKKADFVAEEKGGFIFSEFMPAFDGMFATVKLLEFLARYGQPLSTIVDEIPEYIKIVENVPVPWDKRGAVMKELVVLNKDEKRNVEGIEFFENDNRILIIPDNDRPYFHIYVEAKTKASAKALIEKNRKYFKKIIEKI
jgi:mannose-1-phosphate guanylyltransferase/phosphomannomutase